MCENFRFEHRFAHNIHRTWWENLTSTSEVRHKVLNLFCLSILRRDTEFDSVMFCTCPYLVGHCSSKKVKVGEGIVMFSR